MADYSDADWVLEVLQNLNDPGVDLAKNLLRHMTQIQEEQDDTLLFEYEADLVPESSPEFGSRPAQRVEHLRTLKQRLAIYKNLREQWQRSKNLPVCIRQCQVLRETSFLRAFGKIVTDPIHDNEFVPLSRQQAIEYGHQALKIAVELDDKGEVAESSYVLSRHYTHTSELDRALEFANQSIAVSDEIGDIHILNLAYRAKGEILSLLEVDVAAQIEWLTDFVPAMVKEGDVGFQLAQRSLLAKYLILSGDHKRGDEELESIADLFNCLTEKTQNDIVRFTTNYHPLKSYLHYCRGELDQAYAVQMKSVLINHNSNECRDDVLLYQLAWLEHLSFELSCHDEFLAFCDERMSANGHSVLRQWCLRPQSKVAVEWNEFVDFSFSTLPSAWEWFDLLQKGSYKIQDGFIIQPVMATGIGSDVSVVRLMKRVEGDFVFETQIDLSSNRTCAGGILVIEDNTTLLRYGCGIQSDGEITLTEKSKEHGIYGFSRGMLKSDSVTLRIARNGDQFSAWCGDGQEWFSCGELDLEMADDVQVGVYAECTYRDFSIHRCTATPVKFKSMSLFRP